MVLLFGEDAHFRREEKRGSGCLPPGGRGIGGVESSSLGLKLFADLLHTTGGVLGEEAAPRRDAATTMLNCREDVPACVRPS